MAKRLGKYCSKGLHIWTDENIRIDPKTGNRRCLPCKKDYQEKYRKKQQKKISKYQRLYYEINKDKKRVYYLEHRDEKIAAERRRRLADPERFREYNRQFHLKRSKSRKVYMKEWRKNNPDYQRNWNKQNPDKKKEIDRRKDIKRRARKLNQVGEVSPDIEEVLWLKQEGLCYYCNASLDETGRHLEHMVPISRGGLHEDKNLCLSCPSCNWHKHTMTSEEFTETLCL